MSATVTDFVDVRARAAELGLAPPTGFALLPRGFETAAGRTQLRQESEASTLRKVLADAGVEVEQVGASEHMLTVTEKSADWISPIIFVGSMLWSQNPYLVPVALDVIASYVADFLKGRVPTGIVRLSFAVETSKSKTFKKLTFEGPVSGIAEIPQLLRELHDE